MKNYNAILIGNGTMGKRHRARFEMSNVHFEKVLDMDARAFLEQNEICKIDFAVIASPATTHFEFAKYFLERGIPAFVEKPLATTAAHAHELVELARKNNTIVFVAQSECFNPIFLNFRRHFLQELKFQKYESVLLEFRREHGFTERCRDVNVSLDLLVHDLALFLTMFDYGTIHVVKSECSDDRVTMQLQISKDKFKGLTANFIADRNSAQDIRTISAEFAKCESMPAANYSVSLVHYTQDGDVKHIPNSLDNEHKFFLRLLAGACKDWGDRAANIAAQVVELATSHC